jgi:hypothetical protein
MKFPELTIWERRNLCSFWWINTLMYWYTGRNVTKWENVSMPEFVLFSYFCCFLVKYEKEEPMQHSVHLHSIPLQSLPCSNLVGTWTPLFPLLHLKAKRSRAHPKNVREASMSWRQKCKIDEKILICFMVSPCSLVLTVTFKSREGQYSCL